MQALLVAIIPSSCLSIASRLLYSADSGTSCATCTAPNFQQSKCELITRNATSTPPASS